MAPSVSAVSGTVATGNSLTLTCSGAGTKVRNKPFLYANWQEGTLSPHTTLSNAANFSSAQNRILSTDATNARWGSNPYVAEASWPRDGTAGGRSAVLEADVSTLTYASKLFIFGYRKWLNPDSTGNYKWWRLWPSSGAGNYPDAYLGDSDISDTGNRGWFTENGAPVTGDNRKFFTYPVPSNTWQFDEIRLQLNSAAGVVDGNLEVRVNNTQLTSDSTFAFDFSGIAGPLQKVDFQDTKANADPGSTMRAFVDTFYVDDSWNRVYIGDNATFSSCTHLEIQPFSSWSNTSVTINCQLGSFASVATGRYLFLVDNSNTISASFDLTGAAGSPAPTITSLSVSSGPTAGATSVTATGTGFVATPTVTVGGVSATSVVRNSATSLSFVTPAGTAGAKNVVVTNPDTQTATLTSGFTYVAAPTVTACSPSTGGEAGSTHLTLTGTGFSGVTGVTIGGTACTSVTTVSTTSVTCLSPAKVAGVYNIVVTNSDGQTGTLSSGYTYSAPPVAPTFSSCAPNSGPVTGSTIVVITGSDFTPTGMAVLFGTTAATAVNYISPTVVTCTTPPHIQGGVKITLTNSYSLSASAEAAFTYVSGLPGRRRSIAAARQIRRT